MNFVVVSILVIATFSSFPANSYEVAAESEDPKVLSLTEHDSHHPVNDNCVSSGGEVWQESDHEVLIRNERGTKNNNNNNNGSSSSTACKYAKGPWTECDAKTNARSRTLTLKKGDTSCVQTRTIQKKCKKACRYEKGTWSECTTGQMQRTDKLKTTTDSSCQQTRTVNKNCNNGKSKDKKNKEERKTKNGNKEKGRKNRQ